MRIDALNQRSQVYGTNEKRKINYASRVSESDKLEISSFGKDLQTAKQAVAKASDIREDKVNDLKKQFANGTYHVTAEELADKLLAKL